MLTFILEYNILENQTMLTVKNTNKKHEMPQNPIYHINITCVTKIDQYK